MGLSCVNKKMEHEQDHYVELCCVNTELAFSLLCINSPLDVLLYIIQLMLFDLVSLSDIKPLLSSDDEDEEEFQSHSSPQKDFRQGRRQVVPPVVLGAPVALFLLVSGCCSSGTTCQAPGRYRFSIISLWGLKIKSEDVAPS